MVLLEKLVQLCSPFDPKLALYTGELDRLRVQLLGSKHKEYLERYFVAA